MTVEVGDRAKPEPCGLDRVHLGDAALLQMRCRSEPELFRLVQQRGHDVRPFGTELQPIDAVRRRPAHVLTSLVRRIDSTLRPSASGALVVVDSRGDDLVLLAALLLANSDGVGRERHTAHRGHAVRQPELVRVLRIRIFRRAAGVDVHIDEAREQVHPRRVDFMIGLRRTVGAQRQPRRTRRANRRNPVALHDDVNRPLRRCPGAVDQHGSANGERLERSQPFVGPPIRRRIQRITVRRLPLGLRRPHRYLLTTHHRRRPDRNRKDRRQPEQFGLRHTASEISSS